MGLGFGMIGVSGESVSSFEVVGEGDLIGHFSMHLVLEIAYFEIGQRSILVDGNSRRVLGLEAATVKWIECSTLHSVVKIFDFGMPISMQPLNISF